MALVDTDLVSACIEDARAAAQSIAEFSGKVIFIYDENDLADKIKGMKVFPGLGVVYEGMTAITPASAFATAKTGSGNMGSSAELVLSFIVISQPETLFNADTKTPAILHLTALRRKMLDRRSPTGHFWKFQAEARAALRSGVAFWVQRWQVPIQLQHNKA